jgi:hypothetical protein
MKDRYDNRVTSIENSTPNTSKAEAALDGQYSPYLDKARSFKHKSPP